MPHIGIRSGAAAIVALGLAVAGSGPASAAKPSTNAGPKPAAAKPSPARKISAGQFGNGSMTDAECEHLGEALDDLVNAMYEAALDMSVPAGEALDNANAIGAQANTVAAALEEGGCTVIAS